MSWTDLQLKAADAALNPPVPDPAQAAAALVVQPLVLASQRFSWAAAKRIARESATGDWARIVTRARQTAALPPATALDAAILAAINAVESSDGDTIDPNDPGSWGAWQAGLAALHGIGDLSDATLAALNLLPTPTVHPYVGATGDDIVRVRR